MHSRHFFITEKNTMNPGQTSKTRGPEGPEALT